MGETKRSNYDAVAMIIHWVTAVLMIFMVFWGEDLMKDGEHMAKSGDAANATFEPSIHASIGITILALTLLRILWRVTHTAPAYPATMKHYEVVASKAVHGLFYLLLIGIPLTGWFTFGGFSEEVPAMAGIQIFGAFPLPQPPFTGEIFKEMHELGSNLAMVLIGIHVLAALKHQFYDKDNILKRMLPY